MGGLGIALLVLFVIICAIIIFLVLLQNEEGDSLGGLFSGGSNSAFGSKSSNVLTRATYVVVALFFVTTFLLALITKTPSDSGLSEEAMKNKLKRQPTGGKATTVRIAALKPKKTVSSLKEIPIDPVSLFFVRIYVFYA